MKLNHELTKREIGNILLSVQNIAQKATVFNNQKGNILKNKDYSQDAQNRYIYQLTEKFKEDRRTDEVQIERLLDSIAKAESENEQIYDFADADLQGAISLIKATRGKLDEDTRKNMVNTFKGFKQALIMLRDVFAAYEIDINYLKKYIFDVAEAVEDIKNDFALMPENVAEYAGQLQHICDRLFNLAELLGIKLTDSEKDTKLDLDEYYNSLVRGSLGI